MGPIARLFASAALLSAWLVLLFLGHTLNGVVHLLLLAAILCFPRRRADRSGHDGIAD